MLVKEAYEAAGEALEASNVTEIRSRLPRSPQHTLVLVDAMQKPSLQQVSSISRSGGLGTTAEGTRVCQICHKNYGPPRAESGNMIEQ